MLLKQTFVALALLITSGILAQQPLEHPHRMYRSPEGKLYVNRNDPIYLRISASAEEKDNSYLLQSESTAKYANPMYFDTEGYNTIRSPWKVDPETREYVYPKKDIVFAVYADSKPPSSRVTFGTEDRVRENQTIYVGEPVDLNFSSSDNLSGVDSIYYSIDGKPYQGFDENLTIDDERTFRFSYYAVDHVGNVEKPNEVKVVIDLSNPATKHQIKGDQYNNIISARSEIHLQASDKGTNVRQTYYTIDGQGEKPYRHPLKGSALTEGEHTIAYYSVDKVGNKEDRKTYPFFVDKTPPTVVEELLGNSFSTGGREYFSGRNKLKLISMDNKAGVKEIRYSINKGAFKVYKKPFNLSKSGNLYIETLAIDRVNNKKRTQKMANRDHVSYVDLTGPELGHRFQGPSFSSRDTTFITPETRILLKGEDSESGFKRMEYTGKNENAFKTYEQPFTLKEEGLHLVRYRGYDNLDNTSSGQFLCIVDQQGPDIYHRFSMVSERTRTIEGKEYPVFPPHVVLFLSATDAYVGFDKMYYSINGGERRRYQSLIEGFQEQTLYRLKVTALDKLGNKQEDEIGFYVD